MDKLDTLIKEVQEAPEPMLDEVLDFVRFLKAKQKLERHETALASEEMLKNDWLRPEEDDSCQDL